MSKNPLFVRCEKIVTSDEKCKLKVKAHKGKRVVVVNQYDQILIVDDKGYVVAVKK